MYFPFSCMCRREEHVFVQPSYTHWPGVRVGGAPPGAARPPPPPPHRGQGLRSRFVAILWGLYPFGASRSNPTLPSSSISLLRALLLFFPPLSIFDIPVPRRTTRGSCMAYATLLPVEPRTRKQEKRGGGCVELLGVRGRNWLSR